MKKLNQKLRKMDKKGQIWENTNTLILIVIALIILILFLYFLRDKLKEYVEIVLQFLKI